MSWVISIIIGALVGWLAGKIMKSSHGLLVNILLGFAGSFVGNFVAEKLSITSGSMAGNIVISLVGACLVLFVFRLFSK